jgi:hypothetical protein
MSHWGKAALVACQRHDVRPTKRLAPLVGRLSERPVHRLPRACHGWAETGAASRVLDNPDIGVQEMLSGHTHATLERLRVQESAWLVQETTSLEDGTTPPQAGMGTGQIQVRDADLRPPPGAFTPERVHRTVRVL